MLILFESILVGLAIFFVCKIIEESVWYCTGNHKKTLVRMLDEEFGVVASSHEEINKNTGKRRWVNGSEKVVNLKTHHLD